MYFSFNFNLKEMLVSVIIIIQLTNLVRKFDIEQCTNRLLITVFFVNSRFMKKRKKKMNKQTNEFRNEINRLNKTNATNNSWIHDDYDDHDCSEI